jgi:ABC-type branched-subunit amino acid transport system substrate-binding protein
MFYAAGRVCEFASLRVCEFAIYSHTRILATRILATRILATRILALLLAASHLLILSACAGAPPVVKIGLVAPFEGRYRPLGYDTIYSARLAVRESNQAGNLGPYRVALVALDDSGDPELARETAASLVVDPGVMIVVGHWLPETTASAAPVYAVAGVPFIAAGEPPFAAVDPVSLPDTFRRAYAAVTPFDEVAGPYAAPAYDTLQLALAALAAAQRRHGVIDRATVAAELPNLRIEGITGPIYQP